MSSGLPSPKDLLEALEVADEVSPRIKHYGETIVDTIRGYVARKLTPLDKRLNAAEARGESADALIADLDAQIADLKARISKLEDRK